MFAGRSVWRGARAGFVWRVARAGVAGVLLGGVLVLGWVSVAFGASPEPPELRVEPVFVASAMFVGVLNPHAAEPLAEGGTYQFVYREAASGGCKGAGEKVVPVVAGSAAGAPGEPVSEAVTGLKASTGYVACLVAENAEGKAASSPVSFVTKTPVAPEAPEVAVEAHVPSPALPSSEAVFRGVLSPAAGEAVEPGSYRFVYRQTSSGECTGAGEKLTVAGVMLGVPHEEPGELVKGLAAGTEYAVCLVETQNDGETSTSPGVSFRTATPPEAPQTGSPVTGVTASSATVAGVLNPGASGSAGWRFAYSNPGGASCSEGPQTAEEPEVEGEGVAVGPTELSGLEAHAKYRVCLVASNSAGEDAVGNEVAFETLSAAPVIGEESITALTSQSVSFQALVNPNNQETSFSFEYSTQASGETLEGSVTTVDGAEPLEGFGEQVASAESGVLAQDTTYFYRVVAKNTEGEESSGPLQRFTTLPETPENVAVSEVGGASATLTGVLNPKTPGEVEAGYEFLYQPETESECEAGKHASGTSGGASPEQVQAKLTGLQPNTTYAVCLRVRNGAGETAVSTPPVPFTTLATPIIEAGSASNETENTADLQASVNPDGSLLTQCVFEYATSSEYAAGSSYAQQTPCSQSPAEIGSASSPVAVTAALSGLHANTTYHWRLTAANAAGPLSGVDHTFFVSVQAPPTAGSCPQEQVRQETHSTRLPDCRGYEQVTPVEKNGAHIEALFAGGGDWGPLMARNGEDVMAPAIQCFAQTESCTAIRTAEGEPYEFQHTNGQGWATHPLAPPATTFANTSQLNISADTHTTLFSAPGPGNRDHFYRRTGQGTPQDLGPLAEDPEPIIGSNLEQLLITTQPTAGNSNFSRMVFVAQPNSGGHLWSLYKGLPEIEPSLYEYAGQGTERPLAVAVTGGYESTTLVSECGAFLGGQNPRRVASQYGSLSADGRTVYFTALDDKTTGTCPGGAVAPPANELFARVDGETPGSEPQGAHTVAISAPTPGVCVSVECQASQAASEQREAAFEGASEDGSRVFFTSTGQLTDAASQGSGSAGTGCHLAGGSGCNLYESVCVSPCGSPGEEPAAKERQLIDISAGAKGHGGPRVQGVMAISTDGSHVYFVARGKLASNPGVLGTPAQEGQNNLYVYSEGEPKPLKFIAALPPADEEIFVEQKASSWTEGIGLANVTPDGRFLLFLSHGALTADDTRPEGPAQIYRYDAQTATIVRVTAGQDGYNDNGNAASAEPEIIRAYKGWNRSAAPGVANPSMSDDGQYVYFESPVALTPGALNEVEVNVPPGQRFAQNIYEYHDGVVSLISDGRDLSPNPGDPATQSATRLVGTDATGHNAFFWTVSKIASQDTDTERDMYDARICEAGDPCVAAPAAAELCEGEACHLPGSSSSVAGVGGSNTLQGTGNLEAEHAATTRVAKPRVLTRTARGARFALRVTLDTGGRLVVSGASIEKVTRTVKAAGTQVLRIVLTPAARRTLARKHKLTVKLKVTFTPAAGGGPVTLTTSLTVKQ